MVVFILMPELLHYLRHTFTPTIPWIAEVDIMQAESLCRQYSTYEQYLMHTDIRAWLLQQARARPDFRRADAARLLLRYIEDLQHWGSDAGGCRSACRRRGGPAAAAATWAFAWRGAYSLALLSFYPWPRVSNSKRSPDAGQRPESGMLTLAAWSNHPGAARRPSLKRYCWRNQVCGKGLPETGANRDQWGNYVLWDLLNSLSGGMEMTSL